MGVWDKAGNPSREARRARDGAHWRAKDIAREGVPFKVDDRVIVKKTGTKAVIRLHKEGWGYLLTGFSDDEWFSRKSLELDTQ